MSSANLHELSEWRERDFRDFEIRKCHKSKELALFLEASPSISIEILGLSETELLASAVQLDFAESNLAVRLHTYRFDDWKFLPPTNGIDACVFWLPILAVSSGGLEISPMLISDVRKAIDLRLQRGVSVYVLLPEPSISSAFLGDSLEASRLEFIQNLHSDLKSNTNLVFLPWESWLGVKHISNWATPKFWEVARMPGNTGLISSVAKSIASTIRNDFGFGIKAIAVDLDDTLWSGVLGDAGIEGLGLDRYGEGRSHLELQRFLVDQFRKGIFIGVISKNNQKLVDKAFEVRAEMLLTKDNVAFWGVSWDRKSSSILAMAKHLNIHPSSIVFMDDSEFEISEVRTAIPGIQAIHISGDRTMFLETMRRKGIFQGTRQNSSRTSNDSMPTIQTVVQGQNSYKIAIRSLDVNLDHLDRASNLIIKTNQFNLTSNRTSRSELWEIAQNPDSHVIAYEIDENHHPKGILSVLIVEKKNDHFAIKEWVLSCRAFSRGIEWWILKDIAKRLAVDGIPRVACRLQKTDRTSYLENFLGELTLFGLLEADANLNIQAILDYQIHTELIGELDRD
jgi:FkbH-like protein